MWARIKRIFRSIIGWFIELGEDPELILKQNIRDLEDQVPALNENLAMIKAQVTLIDRDLIKLNDKEQQLTAKIRAALKKSMMCSQRRSRAAGANGSSSSSPSRNGASEK